MTSLSNYLPLACFLSVAFADTNIKKGIKQFQDKHDQLPEMRNDIAPRLFKRDSELCDNCTHITLPEDNCSTEWVPNYVKSNDDDDCFCVEKYTCCPSTCKNLDMNTCRPGFEIGELGRDCCGCSTLRCIDCPLPISNDVLNCTHCEKYVKHKNKHPDTGCYESACVPIVPDYPEVHCNDVCQKEDFEYDSCGYKKPVCKPKTDQEKVPCPCDKIPTCSGSQIINVETDICGCQHPSCGCQRNCPLYGREVIDTEGVAHRNWCEFSTQACIAEVANNTSLDIASIANVRLVNRNGFTSTSEGHLEVFHAGEWGTVCDDLDDGNQSNQNNNNVAIVVCRMLGRMGGVVHNGAELGQGSGRQNIWLDSINCNGGENSLLDCSHKPWGDNDCGHGEDLGVTCS